MLVGRDLLLAAGEAALSDALAGRGRLLLLAGEAGIGKTALANAVSDRAEEAGALVRVGACWESEGLAPFTPWIEALHAPGGDLCADVARRLHGDDAPDTADATAAQRARTRLLRDVVDAIRDASAARPHMILLEDVHWADDASLELLVAVAAHLPRMRALVVVTYRGDEVPPGGPLASLGGGAERLTLTGLDRDAVAMVLGDAMGRPATPDEVAAVARQTAGNPLFVTQVARLIDAGSGTVPSGVRDVLQRRLARLSSGCVRVLGAASVLGTEFEEAHLAAVVDAPVGAAIDEAVAAGLMAGTDGQPGRWSFVHALVREARYASLGVDERAELHRRAADALDRAPSVAATAVVHHVLRGRFDPADQRPAELMVAAGREALDRMSWADAEQLFERAIAAAPAGSAGDATRAQAWLGVGDARLRQGAGDVRAAFDEAAALARRLHRSDLLARAALGFGVGLGAFEVRLVDHHQIELLEEAAAALDDSDPLLALVLARLSVALSFVETRERRHELASRAVDLARAAGDPLTLGCALSARCDVVAGPDGIDERLASADEMIVLASRVGDLPLELLGRRHRVLALLERVEVAAAEREVVSYERTAQALGDPMYLWYVALWRAMLSWARGEADAASAHLATARELGRRGGSHNSSVLTLVFEQMAAIDRRDGEAARRATEALIEVLPDLEPPYVTFMQALVTAAFGDVDTTRRLLDAIPLDAFDTVANDSEWLPSMAQLGVGASRCGHEELARYARERLQPYGPRGVIEGIGAYAHGSVDRFLAVAAGAAGDAAAARSHLDSALGAATSFGPLVEAFTALDGARALREAGDPADATRVGQLARRAAASFERLGFRSAAAEATSLAAEAPTAAAPTPARAAPGGTGSGDERPPGPALRRQGDAWSIAWDGRAVHVRHSKGLADLAVLLERPGHEVHVRELEGIAAVAPRSSEQPVLDDEAVRRYRRRLAELEDDLDEADRHQDAARAARLAAERDALVEQLTTAFGLGGRPRRAGSDPDERLRKAVSARVRAAIDRIEGLHPALGRHLRASIRTGFWCSYQPERTVIWHVDR